jgi:hypothetical protein
MTHIQLLQNEKRVVLDNVIDRSKMPLVPLEKNGEYYSFEFPFQFTGEASLLVDNGTGFHRLPKDYLPGARIDGATPQHVLSLVSAEDTPSFSASLLQREDFYDLPLRWPGKDGKPGPFLNEVRVDALRKADQGDMKDVGVTTLPTVEPGYGPFYTSSFAITSGAGFDPVQAYRAGWEFDVPLIVSAVPAGRKPREASASFLSVTAPNVVVLAFKPSVDGNRDHFALRLQEIEGKESKFAFNSPLKITSTVETSMTEEIVTGAELKVNELRIGPHETLTLQFTLPHASNDWTAEAAQ